MLPYEGWNNLKAAHRMGVSWGKIWALIGAVALLSAIGFGVAIFIGQQNAKMVEKKIDDVNTNAQVSNNAIQKQIQDQVNQKLRQAGIEPVKN